MLYTQFLLDASLQQIYCNFFGYSYIFRLVSLIDIIMTVVSHCSPNEISKYFIKYV